MEGLKIGQLAKEAGVGVETVRFYERKGLIDQPEKPWRSFRGYPAETVLRIRFIRRAKALGFSLAEIADLLNLRIDGSTACEKVHEQAQAKIDEIDFKIRALKVIKGTLRQLTAACVSEKQTGKCPILAALDARPEKMEK